PEAASASILFILLAVAFGFVNSWVGDRKPSFIIVPVIAALLRYYFVYLGTDMPLVPDHNIPFLTLLGYVFTASVTPVSLLLQPRDYLNSFLLYGMMAAAVAGVIIANPQIEMSTEVQASSENLGYVFPVLFVTIACGAISGFHSLVASGTTSKQL